MEIPDNPIFYISECGPDHCQILATSHENYSVCIFVNLIVE